MCTNHVSITFCQSWQVQNNNIPMDDFQWSEMPILKSARKMFVVSITFRSSKIEWDWRCSSQFAASFDLRKLTLNITGITGTKRRPHWYNWHNKCMGFGPITTMIDLANKWPAAYVDIPKIRWKLCSDPWWKSNQVRNLIHAERERGNQFSSNVKAFNRSTANTFFSRSAHTRYKYKYNLIVRPQNPMDKHRNHLIFPLY